MRSWIALVFLAACDLRPAPPKQEPPKPAPPPSPAVIADAGAVPVVPDALADNIPTVDATVEPTAACLAIGEHIASLWIDTAKDVAEKAALIQDRAKLVRKSAEACTQLQWSEAMRTCYLNVTTVEALRTCADVK